MKKIIISALSIVLLLSCGRGNNEEKGLLDTIEEVSDLSDMVEEAEKIEEDSEELIKATPISNDELKELLPETLLELPRKKFSVGNQFMLDVAMAEAEYENEDGDMISLSIMDGAGETGSAMVSLTRLSFARDFEEQSEGGYRRSATVGDYKAIEEVERDEYDNSENAKIELLISNRFLVSIEGRRVKLQKLKKVVEELDLKALERKAG